MKLTERLVSRALLALVVALHVALTLRFEPLSAIFGPTPVAFIDYDTHYEQTLRALEAFRASGRTWGWDPHLLAGSLSGAIFDADNKLHELFVIAGDALGVAPARSFNVFILLAHLLLAPVVYLSARLFRLGPGAAALATLLASLCWFFDAFSHWVFWVGMISYGFAAYLVMLPVALFYRFTADRTRWLLAPVALLLTAIHHLHPYSFFALVAPFLLLWLRARKTLTRLDHALVVAVAAVTVLGNLWWLRVALRFWHYILDSQFYLDATLSYALTDWLGFLKEPSTTGVMAMRSGFRTLALGGAVACLFAWRRERDDRFALFATTLGILLGAAYLGGYLAPLRQVQPYRFSLPATFLAAIPAAAFLSDAVRALRAGGLPRPALALVAVLAFVAAPRLVRDALYFLPEYVPRHTRPLPAPPPNINGAAGFGTIVWPEPFDYSHARMGRDPLVEFVRDRDDGTGRWLVEWWGLGERLAWATDAQVIGGFRELNLAHSDANLFRRYEHGAPPDRDELRRYFERYNVQWVIVSNPKPALESRIDLLEPVAIVLGSRIYRTRVPHSFFEGGGPGQVRATLDRLEVTGSRGGNLVLRYHWLETLVCRPGCRVRRVRVPGDRVGFLGVEGAPPDFEVLNP